MTPPYPKAMARFPRIRQSTLATFDRCALSAHFEAKYSRRWSTLPQSRGTLTHRILAECLAAMSRGKEQTINPDVAVAIFHEQLRQHGVDRRCPMCAAPARFVRAGSAKNKALWPAGGRNVCTRGHETESDFANLPMSEAKDVRWIVVKWANDNVFDIENLVDVEQRLLATLSYDDGEGGHVDRELTGQLDALFVVGERADHGIVLDWKDTWQLPAATEVGFDGYFQQRFYAWLVMKNYPTIQQVTLREHYVRYTEWREAIVWRYEMADIEAELSALLERFDYSMETGNHPPSPGKHCHAMCPRPDDCPIFPAVRSEGAIQSPEQALRYSQQATVAKAALDSRVREMRVWSDVHGPIEVSDHKGRRVWGFNSRKRVARPDRETMALAIAEANAAGRPLDINTLYREALQTRFEEHQPDETTHAGGSDPDMDAQTMAALEASVAAVQPRK